MSGWIKLHRKILDNPIVCKDADHIAVWSYLLLNATHKEHQTVFMGKRITLNPGQLITGRKTISEKFKISESKVQRILKSFENEQQIEQQNGNKNRLITVVSWGEYQSCEHQDEQPVNINRTTTEQQVNTYKNVKNDDNKKPSRPKSKKTIYDEQSIPFRLANYLLKKIREFKPDFKDPNIQSWADDMRKLVEMDKRDPKQIGEVIDWVTANDFWRGNILCPAKLKKQWDAVTIKMNQKSYRDTEKKVVQLDFKPSEEERRYVSEMARRQSARLQAANDE